ncbi:unnamed protein product [Amoebophrya sp. A25]|nr:unnamed protein product [Amoebophrya sp. A25]|eukprot:GSA25T00012450001.1
MTSTSSDSLLLSGLPGVSWSQTSDSVTVECCLQQRHPTNVEIRVDRILVEFPPSPIDRDGDTQSRNMSIELWGTVDPRESLYTLLGGSDRAESSEQEDKPCSLTFELTKRTADQHWRYLTKDESGDLAKTEMEIRQDEASKSMVASVAKIGEQKVPGSKNMGKSAFVW